MPPTREVKSPTQAEATSDMNHRGFGYEWSSTARTRSGPITPDEMQHPAPIGDLQDRRDRDLIAAIADGDEEAFTDLYRRYSPVAMGLAMRVIGQRSLAEDVLQEVFVTLWRSAKGYDPGRGRVRTWLLTQIHHRAVDVVRHEEAQRRRSVSVEIPSDPTDVVVEDQWLGDRSRRIRSGLASLSPQHQQVLTLAYFGGRTQTQIAQETGIPLGTVKTRTLAGMRRLREIMEGGSA